MKTRLHRPHRAGRGKGAAPGVPRPHARACEGPLAAPSAHGAFICYFASAFMGHGEGSFCITGVSSVFLSGALLLAGIVGGEGRVDFVELLAFGGDLFLKSEGGAKALSIGRKTLSGVGGHALLFDEFHLEA